MKFLKLASLMLMLTGTSVILADDPSYDFVGVGANDSEAIDIDFSTVVFDTFHVFGNYNGTELGDILNINEDGNTLTVGVGVQQIIGNGRSFHVQAGYENVGVQAEDEDDGFISLGVIQNLTDTWQVSINVVAVQGDDFDTLTGLILGAEYSIRDSIGINLGVSRSEGEDMEGEDETTISVGLRYYF